MKVNKITTNIYNPLTKVRKNKDMSFKGYQKSAAGDKIISTGGLDVKFDKGWHSDIKKATDLLSGKVIENGDTVHLNYNDSMHNIYFADWDEHPGLDKFFYTRFLVEYITPKDVKLWEVKRVFEPDDNYHIDYHKIIEYTWAKKDKLQRQYDGLSHWLKQEQENPIAKRGLEKELKLKEAQLQNLGGKIDAYGRLQELTNEVENYKKVRATREEYYKLYSKDKTLYDKLMNDIDEKQKAYNEASSYDKEEASLDLFYAQSNKKEADRNVKSYGEYNSLEDRMNAYKKEYDKIADSLSGLEDQNGNSVTVEEKMKDLYQQAEDIYAEFFPEQLYGHSFL